MLTGESPPHRGGRKHERGRYTHRCTDMGLGQHSVAGFGKGSEGPRHSPARRRSRLSVVTSRMSTSWPGGGGRGEGPALWEPPHQGARAVPLVSSPLVLCSPGYTTHPGAERLLLTNRPVWEVRRSHQRGSRGGEVQGGWQQREPGEELQESLAQHRAGALGTWPW